MKTKTTLKNHWLQGEWAALVPTMLYMAGLGWKLGYVATEQLHYSNQNLEIPFAVLFGLAGAMISTVFNANFDEKNKEHQIIKYGLLFSSLGLYLFLFQVFSSSDVVEVVRGAFLSLMAIFFEWLLVGMVSEKVGNQLLEQFEGLQNELKSSNEKLVSSKKQLEEKEVKNENLKLKIDQLEKYKVSLICPKCEFQHDTPSRFRNCTHDLEKENRKKNNRESKK